MCKAPLHSLHFILHSLWGLNYLSLFKSDFVQKHLTQSRNIPIMVPDADHDGLHIGQWFMECHFYFLITGSRLNVGLAKNLSGNLVGEFYKCMFTVNISQVEDSLADVIGKMHAGKLDEPSIAHPCYTLFPALSTPEHIGPFCFQGGAGSNLPIKQRRNLHLNHIRVGQISPKHRVGESPASCFIPFSVPLPDWCERFSGSGRLPRQSRAGPPRSVRSGIWKGGIPPGGRTAPGSIAR